jgi:hypothetical protein
MTPSSIDGLLWSNFLPSCSVILALVWSWHIGAWCNIPFVGALTREVSWLAAGVASTCLSAGIGVVAGVCVASSSTWDSRLTVVVRVGGARCRWWGPLWLRCWSWWWQTMGP